MHRFVPAVTAALSIASFAVIAVLLLLLAPAVDASPPGYHLDTTVTFELDCGSSGGPDAGTVTEPGLYSVRCFNEECYLCRAATCAEDGERMHVGTHQVGFKTTTSVSCRSESGTADLVGTLERHN